MSSDTAGDSVLLSVPAEATAVTLLTDEPDDVWTLSQSLIMKPCSPGENS